MSFHTYNRAGQKLLDSDELVFNFVMSGRLTRLLDKPFEANKRVYSHRAKRLVINSRVRTTVADIYSPEYCMYYIDVPRAVSPLCAIYYDDLAENCNPVVYLNTGYVGSTARMMFYSNGRLSDAELAKFQIYIFDVVATEKETTVGMNLYDREGNVTFSSRSQPMSVHTKYVYDSIPDSYAYVTKREASLTEYGYFSRSKWEDYYYLSKGNHKSEMWNRLNSGTRIRDLVPSTINSKSAGLPSAKVRYLRYYPATAAELAGYIISINNGGLPNPVEGDLFPTLGGHYTHMANKHVLTHTPILTAIGCSDKPAVLFSVPFDDIKRDGTVRHGGTLPDSRRVIFTGRTSFDFVDIQNLPFPFTRRPS
ncbi:hypothetical protein [Moraxella bovis]|uniref:hypothetical protein n=1 Tax=Moraxella bovis TaxID=476 RepID=UPI002226913D|nr:hypothetical protein [Moraxella bovis]UZA13248.1 hypothetical protein LP102_07345 [Moraxella bovis]